MCKTGGDGMRIYSRDEFMKVNKSLHVFRCDGCATVGEDESVHTHEFIEMVYILSGRMTHIIDGKSYQAERGDVLFMNYGCTHGFSSKEAYSYVNVLFSPEAVSEDIVTSANAFCLVALSAFNDMRNGANFGKIRFFGTERKEIEGIILDMLDEYTHQCVLWETVLGNHLSTLIVKMLRKTEMGIESIQIYDVWWELSEYIDNNLDSKLTLSELARRCFYNPSYFSRVFKEKFGITFIDYITGKRLERALYLLQNTEKSITDIGREVGFSDTKGFYHAFFEKMSCTPAAYRKSKKTE